jgi:hypothetical protein
MAKTNSGEQLVSKLRTDKLLRARVVTRLTDTLQSLGVKAEDMSLIPPLDTKSPELGGGPGAQIVIIARNDSKRNTKCIIVGGNK